MMPLQPGMQESLPANQPATPQQPLVQEEIPTNKSDSFFNTKLISLSLFNFPFCSFLISKQNYLVDLKFFCLFIFSGFPPLWILPAGYITIHEPDGKILNNTDIGYIGKCGESFIIMLLSVPSSAQKYFPTTTEPEIFHLGNL